MFCKDWKAWDQPYWIITRKEQGVKHLQILAFDSSVNMAHYVTHTMTLLMDSSLPFYASRIIIMSTSCNLTSIEIAVSKVISSMLSQYLIFYLVVLLSTKVQHT